MSVESILDGAFTELLAKAQRPTEEQTRVTPKSATANFGFGGGGQPIAVAVDPITLISAPTSCDPYKLSVPFPCRIVWGRMCAGDAAGQPSAVSATIDVQLTSFETFGASVPLHGTGTIPTLFFIGKQDLDLTGWQTNLVTGDWLIARLTSFSGLATWVALELLLRPTDVPIGVGGVVDGAADQIVDEFGNVVVLRS